ncbi:hypothetical protein XI09_26170 [Bradyrhizobium sp. CCBAU 11386]|nr:hypothetical protein [Bradyrhizobium sp. CCBAU 11386]
MPVLRLAGADARRRTTCSLMRDITIRQFFRATRDRRGAIFVYLIGCELGGVATRGDVHACASRGARYAQPTYQHAVM